MIRAGLRSALLGIALPACLGACSTTPPAPPPSVRATPAPEAIVAAIRAAAGHDDKELAVQPLRDPMVEDLRESALKLEAQQHYAEAAAALDKALAINPEDPALLQERAEAAVLLHDNAGAETLARRAFALGAKVGPLCRRHWATVRQMRWLANDGNGARDAQTQLDACKVAGPNRF